MKSSLIGWLFVVLLTLGALASVAEHIATTASSAAYGTDKIAMADTAFEDFIKVKMKEWHVPGLAIALLDGDKTWARGYGHATLGADPVTPSTLFYCGSMTKSVTAAALSLLIDRSAAYDNITWNSPISEFLDDFILSDDRTTRQITIADALSHRTGYPRHDLAGPFRNSSVKLVQSLRHLPVAFEPQTRFEYNNLMYGVLGYLIESLTNSSLADFFQKELWWPMKMFDTFLHPDDALANGKPLARSYYWNNDTQNYGDIPWQDERHLAGAGMAISSVLDWSRYLRHMMYETGPISKTGYQELKRPRMLYRESTELYTGAVFSGFGWFRSIVHGEMVWQHAGFVNNMASLMLIMPGRRFGLTIMANSDAVPAMDSIIARTLYDRLDVKEHLRENLEANRLRELSEVDQQLQNCSNRLYGSLPFPPSPLNITMEDLAGNYHHPGYGPMTALPKCDEWRYPKDSPVSPTKDEHGCRLILSKSGSFSMTMSFQLEHKSGEFWLGWVFDDERATVRRPVNCRRVQLRFDENGWPSSIGVDMKLEDWMMEDEKTPLTWFDRID